MANSKCHKKLVCQIYDGTLVIAGSHSGVQAIIKLECPRVYIHLYAHTLSLILLYDAKTITETCFFVYDFNRLSDIFQQMF